MTFTLPKKIIFSLLITLLSLFVFELFLRIALYQTSGQHPFAFIQTIKAINKLSFRKLSPPDTPKTESAKIVANTIPASNPSAHPIHYQLRPHLTHSENDQIVFEHHSLFAEYQPWVQFAWSSIRGRFVNYERGTRASLPDTTIPEAKHVLTVYFLGGSTMFGAEVTDEETIPSHFVRIYKEKFPNGKPLKVVNYGTPYYFSYQELMLLSDRLFNNERPDIVIALDGLNDFVQPHASYSRHPFFTPRLQSLMNPTIQYHPDGFNYYMLPEGKSEESIYQTILANYIENIENAKRLGKIYGFQYYNFPQPVPYYNYTNRPTDPVCDKREMKQFQFAYPLLAERAKIDPSIIFLGDMLADVKQLPFIDIFHYTPEFSKLIAEQMVEAVILKHQTL